VKVSGECVCVSFYFERHRVRGEGQAP
jgi:hypothetical protein